MQSLISSICLVNKSSFGLWFSHYVRLFETLWTVACQTPLSMGISRQEYWSGLPFPSPGDHPNPGIEPGSPALWADSRVPLSMESALSFRSQHICHLLQLTQITLNYYLNYYLKIPIIVLVMCVCVCVLSRVCLFVTPWTIALQALLSMEFSRQEYWSGLPFLTPEDLPDPGIKPVSWPVNSLPLHLSYYAVIFIFIFSSSKLRVSQIKYKSSFFISPVYRIKSGT